MTNLCILELGRSRLVCLARILIHEQFLFWTKCVISTQIVTYFFTGGKKKQKQKIVIILIAVQKTGKSIFTGYEENSFQND